MQGARRRPYVDMVKPGNAADDRPGRNPEGRGNLGAFFRREPSQYRHIASGSPPRTASHIASVAHVPTIEIGSNTALYLRLLAHVKPYTRVFARAALDLLAAALRESPRA